MGFHPSKEVSEGLDFERSPQIEHGFHPSKEVSEVADQCTEEQCFRVSIPLRKFRKQK